MNLTIRALLDYYRTGVVRCPPSVSVQELREATDYFLIPFDAATVKCWNLSEFLFFLHICFINAKQ